MSPVENGSNGPNGALTDAELERLYEFVEGGYRHRSLGYRVRRQLARRIRQLGRREPPERMPQGPEDAPDPLTAVYVAPTVTFFVPLSWCRNVSLFGFGPGSFDAWSATARQLAASPDTPTGQTVLAEFFRRFEPSTAADRLYYSPATDLSPSSPLHQVSAAETKYFWPWATAVQRWPGSAPEDLRLRSHGPAGSRVLELEVWRLRKLVASVVEHGYSPRPGDGIRGQLLQLDGDLRFLIKSGFHRVAVLSALGYELAPVKLSQHAQRLLTMDQLPSWPLVREGMFTASDAALLVERLFSEDGSETARRLGLGEHLQPTAAAPHGSPAGDPAAQAETPAGQAETPAKTARADPVA